MQCNKMLVKTTTIVPRMRLFIYCCVVGLVFSFISQTVYPVERGSVQSRIRPGGRFAGAEGFWKEERIQPHPFHFQENYKRVSPMLNKHPDKCSISQPQLEQQQGEELLENFDSEGKPQKQKDIGFNFSMDDIFLTQHPAFIYELRRVLGFQQCGDACRQFEWRFEVAGAGCNRDVVAMASKAPILPSHIDIFCIILAIMESDEFQLAELRKYYGPVACVKVLLVDANLTCRAIVSKMLLSCGYEVLTATLASDALSIIEAKKNELNLVLVEAHLPDMGICELTEKIKKISDLPSFIITASDYNHPSISKALCKGAKLCFRKPVQMSDLQGLWRFAMWNRNEIVISAELPGFGWHQPEAITVNKGLKCQPSMNTRKPSLEISKETELRDKQKRLRNFMKARGRAWSDYLHNKFLEAVDTAGVNAPARKIMQLMNVPGLTKGRVANYLKKYRQSMRELDDEPQQDVDSYVSRTDHVGGKHPQLSEQQGVSVTNNPAFDQKVSVQLLSPAHFPCPKSSNGQKSCFKQDLLDLPLKQQVVAHPISGLCEFNNWDWNAFSSGGKVIHEDTFLSGVYSTAGQQSHFPIPLANDTWNWKQPSPQFPVVPLPANENEYDTLRAGKIDEIFYTKGNQLFTDEDLKMWLSTIPDTLNNLGAVESWQENMDLISIFETFFL